MLLLEKLILPISKCYSVCVCSCVCVRVYQDRDDEDENDSDGGRVTSRIADLDSIFDDLKNQVNRKVENDGDLPSDKVQ